MKRSLLIPIVLLVTVLSVALSACFYSYMPCPTRYFDTYEELQQTHPEFYYFDDLGDKFEYELNSVSYDGEIRTDNNGAEIDYSRFNPLGYIIFYKMNTHSESGESVSLRVMSMTNPRQPNTLVKDFDTNLTVDNIDCRLGTNIIPEEKTENYLYYLALTFELENVNYAFVLIESYDPENFDPTDPTIEETSVENFIDLVTHAIINRHKGVM